MSDYVEVQCGNRLVRARRLEGPSRSRGGWWGVTEGRRRIQADLFPWQRRWFYVREPKATQVRMRDLSVALGPELLSQLFAAWAEWQSTGVKPATPPGVGEGFMEVQVGRNLDPGAWLRED